MGRGNVLTPMDPSMRGTGKGIRGMAMESLRERMGISTKVGGRKTSSMARVS